MKFGIYDTVNGELVEGGFFAQRPAEKQAAEWNADDAENGEGTTTKRYQVRPQRGDA